MIRTNSYLNSSLNLAPHAVARQGRVIKSAGHKIIPPSAPANDDVRASSAPAAKSSSTLSFLSMIVAGLAMGGICSLMLFLPAGEPYRRQSTQILSFISTRLNESLVTGLTASTSRQSSLKLVGSSEPKKTYPKLTLIPAVEPAKQETTVVPRPSQQPSSVRLAAFSVSTNDTNTNTIRDSELAQITQSSIPIEQGEIVHTNRSAVSRVFSIIRKYAPKNQNPHLLAEAIVKESRKQAYDPLFVAAVIKAESTFNSSARSHRGAQGLMQIMPATGAWIADKQDLPRGKLTDPGHNLKLGITYLKHLESEFDGNKVFTLVAYNWGPGHVQKATGGKKRIPRECLSYALKILNDYKRWQSGLI